MQIPDAQDKVRLVDALSVIQEQRQYKITRTCQLPYGRTPGDAELSFLLWPSMFPS